MQKYEVLNTIGGGSYGVVARARNKETGEVVAIKKIIENGEKDYARKIALREIKMLQQLHHSNIVNLLEHFTRKGRLFLVFEYLEKTILSELEAQPSGLSEDSIIHRDIKPENILVTTHGLVKICDFGFARLVASPGETYTDYVATRWYRSPELLVGDPYYGRGVDVWAIGCVAAEMLISEPLFPGETNVDQIHLITRCLGKFAMYHQRLFQKQLTFNASKMHISRPTHSLRRRLRGASHNFVDFIQNCLCLDPSRRPECSGLLTHKIFSANGFAQKLAVELLRLHRQEPENKPRSSSPASVDRHPQFQSDYSPISTAESKRSAHITVGTSISVNFPKLDRRESSLVEWPSEAFKSYQIKPQERPSRIFNPRSSGSLRKQKLKENARQEADNISIRLPSTIKKEQSGFGRALKPLQESSKLLETTPQNFENDHFPLPSLKNHPIETLSASPDPAIGPQIPGRPINRKFRLN